MTKKRIEREDAPAAAPATGGTSTGDIAINPARMDIGATAKPKKRKLREDEIEVGCPHCGGKAVQKRRLPALITSCESCGSPMLKGL
jgi:hypothetical protein